MYADYSINWLQEHTKKGGYKFQQLIEENRAKGLKFFITEFKRRSPSNAAIGLEADPEIQAQQYIQRGTQAISVLTDRKYFGGSFADMQAIVQLTEGTNIAVLNKDFILDPIQVYLARYYGADIILLIAAILTDEQMLSLHHLAIDLGMGTIAEVHTPEEKERVVRLGLPVIGINNRNLHNFHIRLMTTNFLAYDLPKDRTVIAESGMATQLDFAICGPYAHGFLVGTSLMQEQAPSHRLQDLLGRRYFFKACGMRTQEDFSMTEPDLLGINFSPTSKRRVDEQKLKGLKTKQNMVGLFYENTQDDTLRIMNEYELPWIQTYADMAIDSVQNIKAKWIYAFKEPDIRYSTYMQNYPADLYIMDGGTPGSGLQRDYNIPVDFPFPFLMAGGLALDNVEEIMTHPLCIGVDIASGIETNGQIDKRKVEQIARKLADLKT